MISKVNISNYSTSSLKNNYATPSFGLAKFTKEGQRMAKHLRMQKNSFMNEACFQRQILSQKPAICDELEAGHSFDAICTNYGCTSYADKNASFIRNQILSNKGSEVVANLDAKQRIEGLKLLYIHNYDNPCLTLRETKKLLDQIGEDASSEFYFRNVGLLEKGTFKY